MPKETLIVAVDANTITIQGNVVATIDDINAMKNESSEDDIIPALKEELDRQAARRLELTEEEKVLGRPVTIQGDQKVPYLVLRKIMATSAMSGYRNISLAVVQKELKPEDVGGN
jgi:biopolymer transport protein ExbD